MLSQIEKYPHNLYSYCICGISTHLHALKAEVNTTIKARKRSSALFNKTENPLLIARHCTSSMNFLTIVATYRLIISNFLVKIYLQNKQTTIVPALYRGSVSKLAVSLCFPYKTRYQQKKPWHSLWTTSQNFETTK